MTGRSRFSAEQLKKLRANLEGNLGENSDQVLQNLEKKFGPGQESEVEFDDDPTVEVEEGGAPRAAGAININRIIQEGKPEKMVEALVAVKENPRAVKMLVDSLLANENVKAFHLVDALSKVKTDEELALALTQGIVSKKGINPVIEALRHAVGNQEAMLLLANNICETGTVNHIIRGIATIQKNPDVEILWTMELIGKGSVEQMLEAINLIDKESPGVVILASGIVSHKETAIGQLVQALKGCNINPKASSILAVELAKRADVSALVTLLEKYVSADSEAGEIVVCKLVEKGRTAQMLEACRSISSNSMAGRILAVGLLKRSTPEQLYQGYKYLSRAPHAQQMLGLEIVKKKGKFMALRQLGKEVLDLVKNQVEIEAFAKKAAKRYEWVLKNQEELSDPAGGTGDKED